MGRLVAALQSECLLSGNCWDSAELNTAAAGLQMDEKKQPSVNQWTVPNNNNTDRIFDISSKFHFPVLLDTPKWTISRLEFDLTPNIQSEKVHTLSIMFFSQFISC